MPHCGPNPEFPSDSHRAKRFSLDGGYWFQLDRVDCDGRQLRSFAVLLSRWNGHCLTRQTPTFASLRRGDPGAAGEMTEEESPGTSAGPSVHLNRE